MEYKLEIYAPETEVIAIRDALNFVGAGIVGNYDSVIAVAKVSCFCRPNEHAHPVNGEKNQINFSHEVRIDVRCQGDRVADAVKAIKRVHSGEEPIINVIALANDAFGC
ncbi:hypothetical protein [Celerinatantimonas sp. YJH-8]|uniref:hypothetical protein n=1 Tax=Celerinatantimonas sp. YJH-8 TaxID=3228714 RepID=UPI0038C77C29